MAGVKFTILGGLGFIGAHLAANLRARNCVVDCPARHDIDSGVLMGRDLGNVVYAIGLTGDFRSRLAETVEAHVGLMGRLLAGTRWSSWLYLSSTRVYGGSSAHLCRETDAVSVTPSADSIYDLSKLLGEAICIARPEPTCRVARLANIFGRGMSSANFLGALEAQSRLGARVTINEDRESAKDYLPVSAAAEWLARIALDGRERLYNVASGVLTEHNQVAQMLSRARRVDVDFAAGAPRRRFPAIDTSRLRAEFGNVAPDIPAALQSFFADDAENKEQPK